MGKNRNEKRKNRYPSRAFATIWWILVGIGFVLVFSIPAGSREYITAMVVANIAFAPFWLGSLFYTIHYARNGIRICPNCGKQVYRGKKYCDDCGARVFWYCPKCNQRAKRRDFCENCGQSLKIITYARQVDLDGEKRATEEKLIPDNSNLIVTGSIVQFCPACGAEIDEDLTHCSICGSTLSR
ncbi:MAG: zinc ribbon domain-containing protein [Candidatus Lokiarchaeota archaeon]|nr:zinc ribbon domain-containing protein [Candidatus Lokiarchaeota archaeon]